MCVWNGGGGTICQDSLKVARRGGGVIMISSIYYKAKDQGNLSRFAPHIYKNSVDTLCPTTTVLLYIKYKYMIVRISMSFCGTKMNMFVKTPCALAYGRLDELIDIGWSYISALADPHLRVNVGQIRVKRLDGVK